MGIATTRFVFVNPALDFPQKITYRRATQGWLYATVDGKVGGADKEVTYPMRRIDCESGEVDRALVRGAAIRRVRAQRFRRRF